MFPLKIENDLKLVDTTIREYYGFKNENSKTSTEQKDE